MENIQNIDQTIKLIHDVPYNEATYQQLAPYGMLAHIKNNMPASAAYQDSLDVINQLSLAKHKLDCGCNHILPVTKATTQMLTSVQKFFNEQVIPCTEWPTPSELLEVVNNHTQSA